MNRKTLHIVAFDVPYPANYGGVIDVYHKIRCLKNEGIDVLLHCFEYGRGEQNALLEVAKEVYYYQRPTGFLYQFSWLPFIVKTRISKDLMQRLKEDDHPILMEGLHTTGILLNPEFKDRMTVYRESNIEHTYYLGLAKSEKHFLKKCYFMLESIRLKYYEKIISRAKIMLIVSEWETDYFNRKYPQNEVYYLPSFHEYDEINAHEFKVDSEKFVLFHGNLSVKENEMALHYFLDHGVMDLPFRFVVAGLNPSIELKEKITRFKHVELISNPSSQMMDTLVREAHVHLLYTHQATGLKLKLLNVAFAGKFILANESMLVGTGQINQLVTVANAADDFKQHLQELMAQEFTVQNFQIKKEVLTVFENKGKTKKLIQLIFG